ncbi:MarR family transcriptional regulator [Sphingomonas sp. LB-2]|uniref:MarR family winged helix-turn-helix transcriptional regulator n=1 Tax=Sphingomonas caeni TaxID=2984949 RepID=UPI00222E9A6B|nr:MarR family transcriptional regulator [Sphingomonas caeni]MCW3848630.1 MarR family transcriptional regulator [Sphingomonas caeni]
MSRARIKIGALEPLAGYHLRRASAAFAVDFTIAMEGTGLRQVTFAVLSIVAANPGINQGTVGHILGIKRANMVALINELIEKGLIDRLTDPRDRRAFALRTTASGENAMRDATARIHAHEERMLAGFSEADKAALLTLLERIERQPIPSKAGRADRD